MTTQVELETRMYADGVDRAILLFNNAEDKGRAAESPYAQRLFRHYVLPLAEVLEDELVTNAGKARAKGGHAHLLTDLDLRAVAFLAVRTTLNLLLGGRELNHRQIAYALGKTIHRELVLSQIEEAQPDLFHTLDRDFHRRHSRDERHRMTVFQMQAKEAGVVWTEWTIGSRDQVGMYLLGRMSAIGFVEVPEPITITKQGKVRTEYRDVFLTPGVLGDIEAVKGYISETSPIFGPCVEPPRDWQGMTGGGFHTAKIRGLGRHLVKAAPIARATVSEAAQATTPWVRAVNALQRTEWAVNGRILRVLDDLAALGHEIAGVTLPLDPPKPDRPDFLEHVKPEDRTHTQLEQFTAWKQAMRRWYEGRKLRVSDYGRFYACTRQAREFLGRPLWFVYFLDSRGRAYPRTNGLSPQGTDIQKALLQFHRGLPVATPAATRWHLIHGANKFGFDKATLAERVAWTTEHRAAILASAADPVTERWWLTADSPLQFLAWCFEYADHYHGRNNLSHLPVSMDGSCNGLQHFSAMLRDETGGHATNLTDNETMQDIYGMVAKASKTRLEALTEDAEGYRTWWLQNGLERGLVKRTVMCTPYGVTKSTAEKYIVADYLADKAPGKDSKWLRGAAKFVMHAVWAAIGDVVVKSREAMDWLYKSAGKIIQEAGPDGFITWTTPDGFPATQTYFDFEIVRVRTRLHGEVRIRVAKETEDPNKNKHRTAMAPNFVHSMDATHMRMIALAAEAEGITDMAMIHDDYGTHAANADRFFHILREQFFRLYTENDPLAALHNQHPGLSDPPSKGSLDLSSVLTSDFAFS